MADVSLSLSPEHEGLLFFFTSVCINEGVFFWEIFVTGSVTARGRDSDLRFIYTDTLFISSCDDEAFESFK